MIVLEKYHSNDGTYEDLYEAYSRSLRDWASDSGTDAERERRRGNGYMSEFIAGLGEKWRRELRPSKAQDPRVHRQVFDLLPDLSIYEWRMLMYLLGAKEVVK